MNIFVIPSWYPTADYPHAGIFFREQAESLANVFPHSNFAISTWGSHETDLLLYGKDHFKNIVKLFKARTKLATTKKLKPNLTEYYTPAFTWTRRILNGNINQIIKVNEGHFMSFQREAGNIDIIHAHSAFPAGWVALKLSQKFNIPYVITEHMGPFPSIYFLTKSGGPNHFLMLPFSGSAYNIAVSPLQKEALEKWGIPRLKYVPNLTNEDFFRPGRDEEKEQKQFTIFNLARVEEGKGLSYLLQAYKRFLEKHPFSKLKIGGEGTKEQEYQKLAYDLGLDGHIEWLGVLNREQALVEYQSCDVFVLPSLHENLPLVLLEAIACGKPIISTRCGGPESIINHKNGILVESKSSEQLLSALYTIYDNIHLYNSEAIRAGFMERYSKKVVCQEIMKVYNAAIINNQR